MVKVISLWSYDPHTLNEFRHFALPISDDQEEIIMDLSDNIQEVVADEKYQLHFNNPVGRVLEFIHHGLSMVYDVDVFHLYPCWMIELTYEPDINWAEDFGIPF